MIETEMMASKPDLRSLGRTPIYQEFSVQFPGDALGLEVMKSCDVPVVRRLVRQNARFIGPAEKGGVSVGCILVAVASVPTITLGYDECLRRIKAAPRPMELTFRRIHAPKDPPPYHGRLWQGFLRVFQNGHWTGRFYMLRCNGELQAFAGTDGESLEAPVETLSVVGCTVLSGASARAAAPKTLHVAEGGGAQSQAFWETVVALHDGNNGTAGEEQTLMFFRANNVAQSIEWVSALAMLQLVDPFEPLALWAPISVLKQGYVDKQQSGHEGKQALVGGLLTAATSTSQPKTWRRVWLLLTTDNKLQWFEQAPTNIFEVPLGQLLLWSVKVESTIEDNNLIDSALVSTSATTTPAQAPADDSHAEDSPTSLSTSFVLHAGTRSLALKFGTTEEAREWKAAVTSLSSKSNDSMSETEDASVFEQRLAALRLHPNSLLDRPDVSYSLMAGGAQRITRRKGEDAPTSDAGLVLRNDFLRIAGQYFLPMCDAFCASAIFDALTSSRDKPRELLAQGSTSSKSTSSTKKQLHVTTTASAAQRASPGKPSAKSTPTTPTLVSSSSASSTTGATSTSSVPSSSMSLARSFLESVSGGGGDKKKQVGVEDRVTHLVSASPLEVGVALSRESWSAYCSALRKQAEPIEPWEQLRVKLGLEPSEVLVRVDERVTAVLSAISGSDDETTGTQPSSLSSPTSSSSRLSWTDVGTTFLTNRTLVFLRKGKITSIRGFETTSSSSRRVAHIIPLASVQTLRESGSKDCGQLIIEGVRVVTAKLQEEVVTHGKNVRVVLGFSSSGSSSMFLKQKRAGSASNIASSRQLFREALVELVAAHKISSAIMREQQGTREPVATATAEHWRRGDKAMQETVKAAWALGPSEFWRRKGVAEPTDEEMWQITVKSWDLSLWSAAMLKRRTAIIACTGRLVSQLLVCTRYSESLSARATINAFFADALRHEANVNSVLVQRKRSQHTVLSLPSTTVAETCEAGNGMEMDSGDWVSILTKWLTHQEKRQLRDAAAIESSRMLHGCPSFETGRTREELSRLTAAYTAAFQPTKFRDEWQLFMGFVDPFVDNVVDVLPGTHVHQLLHWDDPLRSAGVLLFLLSIAWHDLVHLVPSMLLLAAALVILVMGSTVNAAAVYKGVVKLSEVEKSDNTHRDEHLDDVQEAALDLPLEDSQDQKTEETDPCTSSDADESFVENKHGFEVKIDAPAEAEEEGVGVVVEHATPRQEPASPVKKSGFLGGQAPNPLDLGAEAAEELDEDQVMALAAAAAAKNLNEQLRQKQQQQQQQQALWSGVGNFDFDSSMHSLESFFQQATPDAEEQQPSQQSSLTSVLAKTFRADDEEDKGVEEITGGIAEGERQELTRAPSLKDENENSDGDEAEEGEEEGDEFDQDSWRGEHGGEGRGARSKSLASSFTTSLSSSLGNVGGAPASPSPPPQSQAIPADGEQESLLTFMRQMRAHLGRMQLHLHRYNTYILRMEALLYWRDIPSTVILLFGLTSAALWFACVPNNYTFALGSLYAFSRPIRLPIRAPGQPRGRRSIGDTLLDQWLDGIPLEGAPTHRDVAVAVQRTLVASPSIP